MKEAHPFTELIPERADQDRLAFNIAQNGVQEPVMLYENKVIEGRVRQRACADVGVQPQYKDWVLIAEGDVIDWMVKRHVEDHELSEQEAIKLVAAVLPHYRQLPGQTHKRLYEAMGGCLSWNKIRMIDWLEDVDALAPVLSGERDVFEVARSLGLVSDKRGVALGKSYGAGDKFDEVIQPLRRYLGAWKRKGYAFRHVNPKEASRRVSLIDDAVAELLEAKADLEKRAVSLTYTAPPERKVKP